MIEGKLDYFVKRAENGSFFMVDQNEPIIISLGGSLIVPNGGIDVKFLSGFNKFIRKKVAQNRRFFIVVGGGKTARHYRDAAVAVVGKITKTDLDWLGVHTTRLNAHLLRTIFSDIAHARIIENYEKKIENLDHPVVIASGWKPGWSTDYDAVLLARDYGAKTILNLTNVTYVYDKDPKIDKRAKPIERTTWEHFEKLVGSSWEPGINAPFDPIATQLAKKLNLTVVILKGDDFANIDRLIFGKKFKGTVVMPFRLDASFFDREYFEAGIGYSGYTTLFWQKLRYNLANLYRALTIKFFLNPKSLLDVGCGTGLMVKYLRLLGVEAKGLEISQYALNQADGEIKKHLAYGNILSIPYKNDSFDIVTTIDVLDHIPSDELKKAINECNRVSQRLCFHLVITKENWWFKTFHGQDVSHVSMYTKSWWENLFADLGFKNWRGFFPRLPQLLETIFILKKKSS